MKFDNDTVVVGLNSKYDEKAYLEEVDALSTWCHINHFSLNVVKTKEMIVDYGRI